MKPASGVCSATLQPRTRDLFPAVGILLEQPADDRQALVDVVPAQLHLGHRQQQLRVVAGRLDGQVLGGGREIAARDERARQLAHAARCPPGRRRAASPSVSSASSACPCASSAAASVLELLERRRALAGPREVAGGDVDVEQLLADLVVVRR